MALLGYSTFWLFWTFRVRATRFFRAKGTGFSWLFTQRPTLERPSVTSNFERGQLDLGNLSSKAAGKVPYVSKWVCTRRKPALSHFVGYSAKLPALMGLLAEGRNACSETP